MFEIIDNECSPTIIKVVGIGGAGCNAVNHMIREGVQGVEFISINTDAQSLAGNLAEHKLQMGPGLGAGGKPDKARTLVINERERIAHVLSGANMVFITAGMGGGTGTGAAPIIAQVARELGVLTVAVVTKPFAYEGEMRMRLAEEGLDELSRNVDSLIVILNEKLMEELDSNVTMKEAFSTADNVLKNAVGGIAEIITVPGLVNVDFEDVRTVLGENGKAMMGSATESGIDRARIAAEKAIASPLLEGIELSGARGVLVNITASAQLGMKEVHEVMTTISQYASPDANKKYGVVTADAMEDRLRVTVIVTGLEAPKKTTPKLVHNVAEPLRTGTDNQPIHYGAGLFAASDKNDLGGVFTSGRAHNQAVAAMKASGMDETDIPTFMRKQAD